VRFDDRLLTVLNQPAGDRRDIAVRWRQLVDLVARAGSNAASPSVARALESIRADAANVDEGLRAAAARAIAALPLPLGLLEYFAADRLSVSAPILAAATLEPAQWRVIMSAADEETRRFIEALHPDVRVETTADLTDSLVSAGAAETAEAGTAPSLHEVVERIERRRRTRAAMKRGGGSASPADVAPRLFRWECGPGGEIAWVDGAPRGAVIGRSIARIHDGGRLHPDVVRAFSIRAPFRDAALTVCGDGALAGEWKISGVPAFEPADGRFAGYRGIALREQADDAAPELPSGFLSDPDSLRELVHEVKTPLNAIMGFAEIIEGQYLGPAEETYRERAKEIVRHAQLLLTAIDDLDFAAKVHSSARPGNRRVDIGELAERIVPALDGPVGHGVSIDTSRVVRGISAEIEPDLAERLIGRLCSAVVEQAEAGEQLRLTIERAGDRARVSMTRPARLAGLAEEQLLSGEPDLDRGFSLRLVQGLARISGAELRAPQGAVVLIFRRG
jgi:signal transduction histidine kinase